MQDVPAAWLAAGALAAILGRRLFEHARASLRARAALGQLRGLGHYDHELQLWLVPGDLAIVAGWPRSEVYVGARLQRIFSPDTFAALLAHEQAHQRRGDMGIHLAAQMLGLCLPGFIRAPLLGELDLAIEQACDAIAAAEVCDPLAVARSLLDAARRGLGSGDGLSLAFCAVKDHLEARIRALCEPCWLPSRRPAAALVVVAMMVLGACITFDPHLHNLSEALFGRLLG
jgi:beta-lactamase regulating signal transducer with metallopeptidase domain